MNVDKTQDVAGEVKTVAQDPTVIPMSVPSQRLSVPEIPGFVLYWMKGTPDRIQRAHRAGYAFVTPEEAQLSNFDLGGDAAADGNTDLGTRVSVIAGEEIGADGQPVRLYLMKVSKENFEKGQKILEDRSASIAEAIRGGTLGVGQAGETSEDAAQRYTREGFGKPMKRKVRTMFDPR